MPIRITGPTGTVTKDYESPFIGPVDHTAPVQVDITGMSNKEIDTKGYLKPGVPLTIDGALVGYGDRLYGVTVEEVKVLEGNTGPLIAAGSVSFTIAVATHGQVNRAVAEDMLERAYTADEVVAFDDSNVTLVR